MLDLLISLFSTHVDTAILHGNMYHLDDMGLKMGYPNRAQMLRSNMANDDSPCYHMLSHLWASLQNLRLTNKNGLRMLKDYHFWASLIRGCHRRVS